MALDEKLTEQIHELRELTRNSSEDFIDEKKKERNGCYCGLKSYSVNFNELNDPIG